MVTKKYRLEDFPGSSRNEKALALLSQAQRDGKWIMPMIDSSFEYNGIYDKLMGYQVLDGTQGGLCTVAAFFYIEGKEFLPGFEHTIIGRD